MLFWRVGAKSCDLIWKATGCNDLWHNLRILLQRCPVNSKGDKCWCGDWDKSFQHAMLVNIKVNCF